MEMSLVYQVWPTPSCKAQCKEQEDKADRRRGGKTTSGGEKTTLVNGQAWSPPSRSGEQTKMEESG